MKKNIIVSKWNPRQEQRKSQPATARISGKTEFTIGVDLGDKKSHYCILNQDGDVVGRGEIATTKTGFRSVFAEMPAAQVALEVGTHSPWVSRVLSGMGFAVIVANPHRVKLIARSTRKNDRIDAEQLARLARADQRLLYPIRHRGEQAQADLAVIRARAAVVKARTELVTAARGLVKSMGERLKSCDAAYVSGELAAELEPQTSRVVQGLLSSAAELSEQIAGYERQIEEMEKRYPEVELLLQVYGVGQLVALTFVLTLEDAQRFRHSRDVGPLLGLVPKQRDSGEQEAHLGISKTGDRLLRSLLVQAAHCVIRAGAPESDLRDWAQQREGKGGKRGKKRTVVAVARKLAVLLHHLWASGEVYDPRYNRKLRERRKSAAA
jgi:transposase